MFTGIPPIWGLYNNKDYLELPKQELPKEELSKIRTTKTETTRIEKVTNKTVFTSVSRRIMLEISKWKPRWLADLFSSNQSY